MALMGAVISPLPLWLALAASDAAAKVSPWTTATSQVYVLPAQKTCVWCNQRLKTPSFSKFSWKEELFTIPFN